LNPQTHLRTKGDSHSITHTIHNHVLAGYQFSLILFYTVVIANDISSQHTLTKGTTSTLAYNTLLFHLLTSPSLVGTGNLDRAAIFNTEGNSVWATTTGFTVSPQEMQEVVRAYKDPGKNGVKEVQSSGLHIGGERFVVIKADERSIYGKKVCLC
jgi:hypothetical protein